MNDKVKAALEARKKRLERKSSNDKVDAALKIRESRLNSNKDSIIADIQSRYNTLLKDYSGVAENYEPSYGKKGGADTFDKFRPIGLEASNLKKDVEAYRRYLGDDKTADEMLSNLEKISGNYKSIIKNAGYYSQFESKDDQVRYEANWLKPNTKDTAEQISSRKSIYEENKARIKDLEAEMGATTDKKKYNSLATQKKKLEEENRQYERTQGKVDSYAYIYDEDDFKEASANRNFTYPTRDDLRQNDVRMDSSSWYYGADGKTYNAFREVVAENDIYGIDESGSYYLKNKSNIDRLGLYLSTDEGERSESAGVYGTWEDIIAAGAHGNWEELTENEINAYYYLLNTSGYEAADKFLDDMTQELNRRATEKYNENLSEVFDAANPLEKAVLNLATVVAKPIGNTAAAIEDAVALITGNEINPYSTAHGAGNFSSQIRGMQAEEFDRVTGGASLPLLDFSAGDAYQATMSYMDMLTATVTGSKFYGAQMGAGAFSDTATDLYKKGASVGEIGSLATISGVAEGLFEKVSIDNLIKLGDAKTLGQVLKNIGIQGGIEASEEIATETTNIIANAIIRGGTSEWNKLLEESGGDVLTALGKEIQQVGKAGLSGFISGALGGGASSVASNIGYNADVAQHGQDIIDNRGYEDLKALALSMSQEASGIKSLDKAVKKADTKTTAWNVGKLSEQVEAVRGQQNTAEIQSALEEKGMSKRQAQKTAQKIAEVAEKKAAGVEITQAEYDAIRKDDATYNVYSSLISDPDSSVNSRNIKHNNMRQGILVGEDGAVTSSESRTSRIMDKVVQEVALGKISSQSRFGANTGVVDEATDDAQPLTAEDAAAYKGKTTYTDPESGETKVVKVSGISTIKDGEMMLKLEGGETVNASDVRFASEGEALVYSTVLDMGVNAGVAEALVNEFKASGVDAGKYALGIKDAYAYGRMNISLSQLSKNSFAYDLSDTQRQYVYKLGASEAKAETKAKQEAIDSKVANAAANGAVKSKSGKVIIENGVTVNEETGDIDESVLTDVQKANLVGIKALAELSPINFHIFQSEKVDGKFVANVNGTPTSANGVYMVGTNDIWIDLNAGDMGEGTMLWTAAHEISHYIKERSPAKWKAMADLLMKEYSKKEGVSISDMLDKQKAKIMQRDDAGTKSETEITDEAYEELVSDALSDMLTDGSIINTLTEIKQSNKGLWNTIKSAIADLLKRWGEVLGVYEGRSHETDEAKALAGMEKAYKKLQKMYAEAFAEANAVEEAIGNTIGGRNLEDFSEAKNTDGKQLFQYRAMEADEAKYRDMLRKWGKMSDSQINNLFTTIDKAMDIIKDNLEVLDYAWEADIDDRAFSPVKPNSDSLYKVSLDFSTLCRKRILQQTIISQLQEALKQPLSREEGIAIRDALMALQEEGRKIEVACALCYVESARMKSPEQIKKFLKNRETVLKDFFAGKSGGSIKEKIKKAEADIREKLGVGDKPLKSLDGKTADAIRQAKREARASYTPTVAEQEIIDAAMDMTVSDFTSPKGLENLAKNHPELFDAYTSYVRNATKSKGIENDTWWRAGDSSRIGDVLIANMNRENGLRSQSWSDFQVIHILDYIAATIELATRNAKEQAYSKVPDYVELMGQTGVMINMSLIPTRKFNGTLEYDSVEGIDYKKALALREKYPATAGTICIGIDNKQIQMLLADITIDYVIPYHRSGMAASVRKLMHIPSWSEFEKYQGETALSDAEAKKNAEKYGVKLLDKSDPKYHKHTSFSEWFDLEIARQIATMENANPSNKAKQKTYGVMYGGYIAMQDAANNYLKLCAERGLAPKFSHEKADFTAEDNYWKLLIDRKMVNNATGEIIEQQTIKPIFDEGEILRILNDELDRYPGVKEDQDYATRVVTENFLSGKIKSGMSAEDIAKVVKKPVDNVTAVNIEASAVEIREFDSSKERIERNIKDIASMSSVHNVDKSKLIKTGKRPSDIFAEYFKEWGYRLHSDELGDISVGKSSIKSEVRHGITAEKIASIEAIPEVLKEGKVIFAELKPNSDVHRIVVCAPIKIGEVPYYMGVMLQRDTKTQRLYLHNVAIEKEASVISQADLLTTGADESNDYLFITSILQNALSVKYQNPNSVKRKNSERNSNGETLSKEQQEFFKDSKARDEQGRLLVLHRGSPEDFGNVFGFLEENLNSKDQPNTFGFFFTDSFDTAEYYSKARGNEGDIKTVYLNIKNPLDLTSLGISSSEKDFYRLIEENGVITGRSRYKQDYKPVWTRFDKNGESMRRSMESAGFDGVIYHDWGENKATYVAFYPEQIKLITNMKPTSNPDIRYSERNTDSNRSLLANALETTVQNDIEANKLKEYKEKINLIDAEQRKLAEINAEIGELSFSKGKRDTERLKSLRFDAAQTANRINTYDRQLLNLESTKVLKAVLQREKGLAMKRQKQKNAEALVEYKGKVVETRDKREAVKKLQKLILDTSKWVSYPTKDDVKVPDIIKAPYAEFLSSIDLSSKRLLKGGEATQNDIKIASAMNSLATAIEQIKTAQNPTADTKDISTEALDSGYLDLPVNFVVNLRKMAEDIKKMMVPGTFVVNTMSSQDIKQISKLIRTLNHSIKEMSTLYSNLRFSHVEEIGDHTISFLDDIGEAKSTNAVADYVSWDNALPYYAFRRFGEGGESIFEELMDAQDKLTFLADAIFKFKEKSWTDKEAKAWGEDTHTITLPSGNEVTLTTADAMGIYCLSRREQAVPHLLGGGIRVVGQKKGMTKASDSRTTLSEADLSAIISSLSKRQIEVAEAIQEFMSTVCAEWGNEISMKRFLTREFREKYYYPIESSDENLPVKDQAMQQADLYRLLNISATKPLTEGANNAVVIRNIFEVFTNHASDMAKLNAYGMALLDYMKWVNYREKATNDQGQIITRGVRQSMNSTYGNKAFSYAINLIKDVNGRYNDGGDHAWLMKMTRTAKTAMVGNSLRVAVLQMTAYPRAGMVLSPKSLSLGLTKKPQIKKAQKYCGVALWKSFGFYDTNIARSVEEQIKGDTNWRQKLIELSLKGAEMGDAMTWGLLWNACEYEVASTNKSLEAGSEEFNQAVGKKLREVVYSTQVVDSILTRSQIMRNKSGLTQGATAFMSEPTVSANILMDAGFQFHLEKRRTGSVADAWKKTGKHIRKAATIYFVGQTVAATIEGLVDAYRDDDDEEFTEKYLEAFKQNFITDLLPFNKIPIISDVVEAVLSLLDIGYFSSDNLSTTWLSQTVTALTAWKEVLGEEESSKTLYNAIYNTTRALSSMTGIAVGGMMREAVVLWNNTAGAFDSTLKVKTYENTTAENGKLLYEAIVNGEDKQAESLKAQFENEDAIQSALIKALRENDPRIKEAAEARFNGDMTLYDQIASEIEGENNFDRQIINKAIKSEYNKLKPDEESSGLSETPNFSSEDIINAIVHGDSNDIEIVKDFFIDDAVNKGKTKAKAEKEWYGDVKSAIGSYYKDGEIDSATAESYLKRYANMSDDDIYWAMDKWDHADDEDYSKYNDFYASVETGKNLKATIKVYLDNGVSEKTLASQITSHFKPIYKEMTNSERARLKGYLLNAYALLGRNRGDASKDIDRWLKDN